MSKQDIDTIEGFTIVSMKASRLQKQNYQNIQWAQGMGEQKPRRKETSFFIEESSVELKPEKKPKPQKAAKPAPPPLLQKHEKQTMPKNATYSYNDKGQIQFGKLVWVLWGATTPGTVGMWRLWRLPAFTFSTQTSRRGGRVSITAPSLLWGSGLLLWTNLSLLWKRW